MANVISINKYKAFNRNASLVNLRYMQEKVAAMKAQTEDSKTMVKQEEPQNRQRS